MKIAITDLLDYYYDTSVTLDEPCFSSNSSPLKNAPKSYAQKSVMHKPLLLAASLLLVICGVFTMGLRSGSLSSVFSTPGSLSPVEIQSVPEEDLPLSDFEHEVTGEHTIYTAYLNIPIEATASLLTDNGDFITKLVINPESGQYYWYYHLPALEALRYEIAPNGTASDLNNEEYQNAELNWTNYLGERYFSRATLLYDDGTTITMGSGEARGFGDSQYWECGSIATLEAENMVTIDDATPVSVVIDGTPYIFETDVKTIETFDRAEPETQDQSESDGSSEYGFSNAVLTLHAADDTSYPPETKINFLPGQRISYILKAECSVTKSEKIISQTTNIKNTDGETLYSYSSEKSIVGEWTQIVSEGTIPDQITLPGTYTLEIYWNDQIISAVAFSIIDPISMSFTEAVDIDGDGLLTAELNIVYESDHLDGTLLRFVLDPTLGEYTWYNCYDQAEQIIQDNSLIGSQDINEILSLPDFQTIFTDQQNYVLKNYKAKASLYFTDGTSIPLGPGDMIEYDNGIFFDTGKMEWLEEDYNISLDGLTPSCIIIDGQRYDFE